MREGLIILPRTAPAEVHRTLASRLIESFGGYTAIEARGAWRAPADGKIHDEPVVQYVVAYANGLSNHKLSAIANWLLGASREQAIYFKFSDGTVKIIHK